MVSSRPEVFCFYKKLLLKFSKSRRDTARASLLNKIQASGSAILLKRETVA